ncbi:putative quinol monooxygenase [Mucilaginibacter sp.]
MKQIMTFSIILVMLGIVKSTAAQHKEHIVRIAKIEIDPVQLEQYKAALREQMTAAVRLEPGVLSYYAAADKKNPSHITIFEIYADSAAYKLHIETLHFKKYKNTVQHMVKSLELTDVDLIGVAKKPEM